MRSPRHRRAIHMVTIAVATVALSACSGGSGDEDATTGDGPATAAPGAPPRTSTPGASAPTFAEPPASTSSPAPDEGYGVVVVDVETGRVASLYEAAGPAMTAPGDQAPSTPREQDGGIWLSPTPGEATRYGLDGEALATVEGSAVLESADGSARSYFTGADGTLMLVVERGETRHELDREGIVARALTDDGSHLAWLEPGETRDAVLHVMDLGTGNVQVVGDIAAGPEGDHFVEWSPSGRYLAYEDPATGVHIADLEATGDSDPLLLEGHTAQPEAWATTPAGDRLVTLRDGAVAITDVESGDELPLEAGDLQPETARALGHAVVVSSGEGAERRTLVFDALTGQRLRELVGQGDVAIAGGEIASAVVARTELACTGIEIVHPEFTETIPCEADDLRWSPDGRYLALVPLAAGAPVMLLEPATGNERELPHPGPHGNVPSWSQDSAYLIWVWGSE